LNATKIVTLLTGLVIVGEALALIVGMHFLSGRDNPWISFKNDLLLILDIFSGLALVFFSLHNDVSGNLVFWIVFGLALLTHAYRDWEYLVKAANQFCLNLPMFIINNLKLAGVITLFLLIIYVQ
jgi:hypothetical protein